MPTVSFRTFGCKLNQAETAMLAEQFVRRGYTVETPDRGADVAVIHTCTVTGRSDAKCRQAVHHALRLNPGATVIVAGCYSQVAARELASIEGVDYVLGTEDKFRLFEVFTGPGKRTEPKIEVTPLAVVGKSVPYEAGPFGGRTRAFLKIQGGCSRRCSYCIVPAARGPSRSEPMEDVVLNARALVRSGIREIVVTGTHLGDYGKDLGNGPRFPDLLERLLGVQGLARLRLSSLDPDEVTAELLDLAARERRICRHFHVALQSGSDTVLKAMNRHYTTAAYEGIVRDLLERFGTVGLGSDVITGFPGESDAQFEETFRFVDSLPFSYLHVFPFSPRPGTAAASMPDQVQPAVRIERAHALRALGARKRREFAERWIGLTEWVLLEGQGETGRMSGFTSEYLRVEVPSDPKFANCVVPVKIERISERGAAGSIALR
jgi:threonylcarbamoyladenosine tRNA methylthiotransferase MtaB